MGGTDIRHSALYERQWAEELDTWIANGRPPAPLEPLPHIPYDTNEFFQYDQYDWENFDPDYAVIRLTQGYFTIVDKRDAKRVMRHKWQANVQRCRETGRIRKIYAFCNVSCEKGKRLYLHRFLTKSGAAVVIDHYNGLSLDNRRQKNLRATTRSGNTANSVSHWRRTKHHGLPRGVEKRGCKFGGQIKCGGTTVRSKLHWNTPLPAHQWYLRKYKEIHGHRCVLQAKKEWPIFPPRKGVKYEVPF